MPNPIQSFFDQLASSYPQKYSDKQPYLQYFFTSRLELATEGLDLPNKTILDIGAGTGALYDFLEKKEPTINYYACDISAAMLEASPIPKDRQFVGEADQISWPVTSFDYIFALGLTTYLTKAQMDRFVLFCARHLSEQGTAVISFTNQSAIEVRLRYVLQPIVRMLFKKKKVLFNQAFLTRAYTLEEAREVFMAKNLYYCKKRWIPATIPFLHYLSPKLSVKISKYFAKRNRFSFLCHWLSPEFILSFQLNGTKTESHQSRS